MCRISVLLIVLVLALAGCQSPKKKGPEKKVPDRSSPALRDDASDVDFQAFVGRLKEAVAARDMTTLAGMMTPDFAFVLGGSPGEDRKGDGVFQYWDENNLWIELEGILSEKFVESGGFMVAPPQFVTTPDAYHGYRAGIKRIGGSWKFVYFVNG